MLGCLFNAYLSKKKFKEKKNINNYLTPEHI